MQVTNIDDRLVEILASVSDPEVPVLSILDLGVVRSAQIGEDNSVQIIITPTYSGCPAMDVIRFEISEAMTRTGYPFVNIETVIAPPWTTDWISEDGKKKLKAYGIAPPAEKTTDKSFLNGEPKRIACPRCNSENTTMVSLFGSTACKSLHKCLDCKEPFDYFKCH